MAIIFLLTKSLLLFSLGKRAFFFHFKPINWHTSKILLSIIILKGNLALGGIRTLFWFDFEFIQLNFVYLFDQEKEKLPLINDSTLWGMIIVCSCLINIFLQYLQFCCNHIKKLRTDDLSGGRAR